MDWTADDLLAQARSRSGIDEFTDLSFRSALESMVSAIGGESRLRADARAHEREELIEALVSRLQLDALLRAHPEIDNEVIRPPLVVVGLQRSGTSKLFRAIASDPGWNVVTTWQGLYPAPLASGPGGPGEPDGPDPRIARAEKWVARLASLGMQTAHEVSASAPEMEYTLLSKNFLFPSPTAILPTHRRWCERADYQPAYDYLRTQLKVLQWQRRPAEPSRWLLKYPFHLAQLEALLRAFPGAHVVMTHRDPRVSVASMGKIAQSLQGQLAEPGGGYRPAREWLEIMAFEANRCLAYRDSPAAAPILDVPYGDVVRDLPAVVSAIYRHAGVTLPATSQASLRQWEAEHRQHKFGTHPYSLPDVGLDDATVEAMFERYLSEYAWAFPDRAGSGAVT
jgi:hypothetical protein